MTKKKTDVFRPYPKYKDSGVPWLGDVPTGWSIFRNGRLFTERKQTGFGELPILEVSLKTGVRVRDMDNMKRKQVMSDRQKYKRARQGDIAYNMMRMWQGAVGVAPTDGLVSPAYVVAKPFPEVDTRFFTYLFRTTAYMNEVDGYSRGIVKDRNRLYWQDFKRMPSVVPPAAEQIQIARFLDWKTAQINRFIRNKRRLIELLRERKQGIVNHAVTRGLDPNVKLKPSGVDWLGDVPEHWEVKRNGALFSERKESGEYGLPILVVSLRTGVTVGEEYDNKGRPKRLIEDHTKYRRALKNDLAYNMMRLWQGAVGVVPQDGLVSPAYVVIRPFSSVFSRFYEYLFRTPNFMGEVNRNSRGIVSDRNRAYWDSFKTLLVPVPPRDEQTQIVEYIQKATEKLDVAISRATREIELILEYRTRLISDAVTGKIDVRGVAVPDFDATDLTPWDDEDEELPDEEEEGEPTDDAD